MWGRERQGGRHAAPTGAARRAATADRNRTQESRPRRAPGADAGEQIAIIGGSAITVLAGRIRRRHTSADVESPTTELSLTLPTPRVDPAGGPPLSGRRGGDRRRRRSAPVPAPAEPTDPGDPAAPAPTDPGLVDREPVRSPTAAGDEPGRRPDPGSPASRRARARRGFPVIAATAGILVPVAALAGLVLGFRIDPAAPAQPAAPTVHEQAVAPSTSNSPATTPADPDRAAAYLDALRAADIPASRSGRPETEAAAAICEQSRRGVPAAELARVLPAMLTDLDRQQARTVVELAEQYYC